MPDVNGRAVTVPSGFERDLAALLNRYSFDTLANTPDYILAKNVVNHLSGIVKLARERDKWFGFDPNEAFDPKRED